MTIHNMGTPIYVTEIQAEFGGGNPFYLSNYYAGGPFVPAGTAGQNGPIPTSGGITLWHFYGASNYIPPVYIYSGNLVAGTSGNFRGYSRGLCGSISPTNFPPFGSPIFELMWQTNGLFIFGTDAGSNTGWNRLIVNGGFILNRGSAGFSNTFGYPEWSWAGQGNPFTQGANHTIQFD